MDAWCQGLASASGLVRTYRAVVSTSTQSAAERLNDLGPVYVVTSAGLLKVADRLSGLWSAGSQPLSNAIEYNEKKEYVDYMLQTGTNGMAWTGSNADGSAHSGSQICLDWTDSGSFGSIGINNYKDSNWIAQGLWPCTNSIRVYCVSQ